MRRRTTKTARTTTRSTRPSIKDVCGCQEEPQLEVNWSNLKGGLLYILPSNNIVRNHIFGPRATISGDNVRHTKRNVGHQEDRKVEEAFFGLNSYDFPPTRLDQRWTHQKRQWTHQEETRQRWTQRRIRIFFKLAAVECSTKEENYRRNNNNYRGTFAREATLDDQT